MELEYNSWSLLLPLSRQPCNYPASALTVAEEGLQEGAAVVSGVSCLKVIKCLVVRARDAGGTSKVASVHGVKVCRSVVCVCG